MSYEAQLRYKERVIKDSLIRLGACDKDMIEAKTEAIIGSDQPYYYRNKVQYPVRDNHGRIEIGFYAKASHRIVETKRCYIQDTYNEIIVETIRSFMTKNHISAYNEESQKGLVRHILIRKSNTFHKFHVTLVINGNKIPNMQELTDQLMGLDKVEAVSLNINKEHNNVILGDQLISLAGPEFFVDKIGDVAYRVSPMSFYQVNPSQTFKLYEKALEYAELKGSETVFDLYCGIGTISLFLAQKAKVVYGVEVVEEAIVDAKENARMNHISNVEFISGTAEEVMPKLYHDEGIKADVVLVDPPRKGCDEALLKTMVEMNPLRIVYVSCDPGTLARDVKYLCENGYQLDKVCGVDMFSHSTHVESVLSMTRKSL
jgi:23S rRNA (uracil1939-C5)-methyltransferase